MKKPLLHLAQRVFNTPLLISKRKFDAIVMAIGPRLGLDPDEFHASAISIEEHSLEVPVERPRASYPGTKWSDFGDYAVTDNGTAIIPIHGTLVRRADWIDAMSGMRSYESIRSDFAAALDDKYVARILLDCDSGGGEVNDCFDLSDVIYAARSIKPIHSFANDYAFSAMYAIASSAQTVSVTRVGGVGSIGVIFVHCDQSEFDKKMGVKYKAIYSGKHKNDFSQHEPLSKDVEAEGQREIDRLDGMFDVLVARNRGLKVEQVDATEAGVYYGAEGVAAGLADQVVTFDELMAQIDLPSAGSSATRLAASAVMPAAEAAATLHHRLNGITNAIPAVRTTADIVADALIEKGESMSQEKINAGTTDDNQNGCGCDCGACVSGDCPGCVNTKCTDTNCMECPMQEERAEENEEDDEQEKPMEAKKETTGAATDAIKNFAADAPKIARMCIIAGFPELAADYVGRGLSFDAALEEMDKVRLEKQPKINSARRAAVTGNAIAEIESQARALASANPRITKQQAFAQALRQNPQAYTEYLRQNPQLDGGKTLDKFEQFGQ